MEVYLIFITTLQIILRKQQSLKKKRYASTISYLTPPAENAGLYKGLKELGELVGSYQQLRESGRGIQIVNAIVETSKKCNLDEDVETTLKKMPPNWK